MKNLDLTPIRVHDNFIQFGGNSLLGAQLVGQLETGFGVALRLRDLFSAPTVAEQGVLIEKLIIADGQRRQSVPHDCFDELNNDPDARREHSQTPSRWKRRNRGWGRGGEGGQIRRRRHNGDRPPYPDSSSKCPASPAPSQRFARDSALSSY